MKTNTPQEDRLFFEENKSCIGYLYERENLNIKDIANRFNIVPHRLTSYIANTDWVRDFNNVEVLRDLHLVRKLKVYEMAEELNCSVDSIRRTLRRNNLKVSHDVRYGSMSRYSFNESFFEEIDSEEKAYWLGFIVADGSVNYTISRAEHNYGERRYDRLSIMLQEIDFEHLEKFASDIEYDGIIEKGTTNSFGGTFGYSKIRITSEKLCSDLIKLGVVPNKSTNETAPSIDPSLQRDFIRGFFDGDGSISISPTNSISGYTGNFAFIGSLQMVEYCRNFLIKRGLASKAKITKDDSNLHYFRSGGTKIILDLYNILYKDSGVFLDRKKELFEKYLTHQERYSPSSVERQRARQK